MRKVTKAIASSTINVVDTNKELQFDVEGNVLPNVQINVDGIPTENRARLIAEKHCKHKNVMVLSIDVDENKLTLSAETFIMCGTVCEPNTVYGREYITQTFKFTSYNGIAIIDGKQKPISDIYIGETTPNKLLKAARENYDSDKVIITNTQVVESRYYLKREKYLELAKAEARICNVVEESEKETEE